MTFIVWIIFILLGQKPNLNDIKEHVKKKEEFCNVNIPSGDTKILEFYKYQKSDEASLIIYAYIECIIEKLDWCKNNLENSSTTKVSEHIPWGFFNIYNSSFRSIERKHDVYRGKDWMRKFFEF